MNFGFNSNVSVGNVVYHVQTEDRGPAHPCLDTIVYESGRVVYKLSTNYQNSAAVTPPEDLARHLHDLLSRQHRAVIAQLETGTLGFSSNDDGPPAEASASSPREGLDVRLLNPTTWLKSGEVTLELQLLRIGSAEQIGGADIESFLESGKERTAPVRARSDTTGRATLRFALPATVGDGAALVIRAIHGSLHGELRFRFKARRKDTAPTEPSK
jgi:hypothetical protein